MTRKVVVANNLPDDYPLVSEGISIHWHGFSMGGAEWYDGVGYLAQCPIRAGSNFTYRFQVGIWKSATLEEVDMRDLWRDQSLLSIKSAICQAEVACMGNI